MTTDSEQALEQLSPQHQAFVVAYLGEANFNATKAYQLAGYEGEGATQSASALLTNPNIQAAVSELLVMQGITPERVKTALAEMAFDGDVADLEDFLRTGKTLKDLRKEGFNTKLIKSLWIKREAGGTKEKPVAYDHIRVEMYDRLGALRELVRVLGIVTEKHQLDVTGEGLKGLTESELLARAHASKPEDGS